MTTAARPTFDTAKGGSSRSEKSLSSLSKQYSARDLPSHTKLKYRQSGQGTEDDLKGRDFRRELEEREHKAKQSRDGKRDWELESPDIAEPKKLRIEDFARLDADEKLDYDEDSDHDSDEEEDTAALLAELNKIKKERAAEEAKRQEQKEAEENRIRTENILSANPLLNPGSGSSGSFAVKRRWDDDVVFKNCAKGEKIAEKRGFVNDSLRSEFHRKFMDRYIK